MISKKQLLQGISACVGLAIIAALTQITITISHWSTYLSPVMLALVLGIALQPLFNRLVVLQQGIAISYKYALKLAIACIGAGISLQLLLDLGLVFIAVLLGVVASTVVMLYWLGRKLQLDEETSILIATGNAICGGTAIAAAAPVIRANAQSISVGVSVIFLFNLLSLLLFPYLQSILLLPDALYGMWVGLSIHDTSSVLAASFAVSEEAGATAAVVKVGRIACLGLVLLGLSFWLKNRNKGKELVQDVQARGGQFTCMIPWYVIVFIMFMLINSFMLLPKQLLDTVYSVGTWLIIAGIFALAGTISFTDIRKAGWRPILLGAIGWLYLSLISFILLFMIY